MTNTGGPRAWQYLKRNPDYVESWRQSAIPAPDEPAPFPLRTQTEADREAAAWALVAREDPLAEDGPASPFWVDAPTLEALPVPESPALLELLWAPEARLSGLRLESGAVILKAEQGDGGDGLDRFGAACRDRLARRLDRARGARPLLRRQALLQALRRGDA